MKKLFDFKYKIITVLLQSNIFNPSSSIKLNEIITKFISKTGSTDYWINYKLARLCVRYSYFNHASVIFDNLKKIIEEMSQKTSFNSANNTKNFNLLNILNLT